MCCDMEWTLAISGNRAVKTLNPSKRQQLYTSNSKRKQLLFGKIILFLFQIKHVILKNH